METHTYQIMELREKFLKKLDEEGPPDFKAFHPADMARIKNTDDWLKRFLEHHEFNLQESFNMLWETCAWRKKFGVNDITENNIKKEYIEDGAIFSYGRDKDGKKLFIIKSKLHFKAAKDFTELQRCVVYWFERLEREENGNQISIFFDMADTGLSNLDMEFTRYLIGLFKSYYPNFLNYIIIFEMPWVLNAAFKIIKSWLPAKAIPKIKFVNKSTLKEFVDLSDALKCWGGKSDYVFTFVSEIQIPADTAINGKLDNRKVHFAEGSPLTEQSLVSFGDQTNEEQLLSIEPEVITFNKDGHDIAGMITLKNITTDKSLSYKIKTTSPEKFRVRPSSGILQPSEQRNITVVLQSGYNVRGLLHNDRFLVMCLPLSNVNATAQELTTLWKSGKPAEQHRLKCCDGINESNEIQRSQIVSNSTAAISDRNIDALLGKMNHLEYNHNKLYNEIITLKHLLLISLILTIFISIILAYFLTTDIQNLMEKGNKCHIKNM